MQVACHAHGALGNKLLSQLAQERHDDGILLLLAHKGRLCNYRANARKNTWKNIQMLTSSCDCPLNDLYLQQNVVDARNTQNTKNLLPERKKTSSKMCTIEEDGSKKL